MSLKLYPQRKRFTGRKKPAKTWVLVADTRQAQLYERDKNHNAPMLMPIGSSLKAASVEREKGRHALSRVFESASTARHMAEPRIDIRQEGRRRFAHQLAQKLEEEKRSGTFDRLILAAPPKMMGDLRLQLSDNVRNSVIAEISKELTRAPLAALSLFLGEHNLL